MKILYVEDEENITQLAKILFMRTTHDLMVCSNIKDAKNAILSDCFDVIILDLLFPGEEDGINLLEFIQSKGIDISVLVHSGIVDDQIEPILKYYKNLGIIRSIHRKGSTTFDDLINDIDKLNNN